MTKNINVVLSKDCTGCAACVSVCPLAAITMLDKKDGFKYPYVDADKCIQCGRCVTICHAKNTLELVCAVHKTYSAINKDFNAQMQSSSAGIFRIIADSVIDRGGVFIG